MPDAKFESGSFPFFGDMTSQIFSLEKETSHRIWLSTPGKWFNLKKWNSMSRIVLLDPKLTHPHVNFSKFQAEENLFIPKIF